MEGFSRLASFSYGRMNYEFFIRPEARPYEFFIRPRPAVGRALSIPRINDVVTTVPARRRQHQSLRLFLAQLPPRRSDSPRPRRHVAHHHQGARQVEVGGVPELPRVLMVAGCSRGCRALRLPETQGVGLATAAATERARV